MRKRPQWPRDLRPLTCRDCGFESRRRHGCLFAVSDVCYHDGRNLSQWSPTECGMSECDRGNSQMRSRATRDCRAMRKKNHYRCRFFSFRNCTPCELNSWPTVVFTSRQGVTSRKKYRCKYVKTCKSPFCCSRSTSQNDRTITKLKTVNYDTRVTNVTSTLRHSGISDGRIKCFLRRSQY